MPEDKSKIGKSDRSRVAGEQDYEVSHIAGSTGSALRRPVSSSSALAMIEKNSTSLRRR
jgi:hypothetical protein